MIDDDSNPEKRQGRKKSKGFQCKQFFVAHDQCAMKVGTDSLMLGSWCDVSVTENILDIGSGCGILSLMLAQKSPSVARSVGVDIDDSAVMQAKANANNCSLKNKLTFLHMDVKKYHPVHRFDCIVSNPPYFESNAMEMNDARRNARLEFALKHDELLHTVNRLLTKNGLFYVVLPDSIAQRFDTKAHSLGLNCVRSLSVRSVSNKPLIRKLLCYGRNLPSFEIVDDVLTIYNNDGSYRKEYKELCRDFYLNF